MKTNALLEWKKADLEEQQLDSEVKKEFISYIKNVIVDLSFRSSEINKHRLKSFLNRLCNNRNHEYWKRICRLCKKDFEHDKKGKAIVYKDFCGSPYCKDKDCFKSRLGLAKLILKSYFYAFSTWRERNQRWLHIILGKKRVVKITTKTLKDFRKDIIKFLNFMRKEYRNPHMIAIMDIAHDGKTFYLHYHVAMRLRGHMDEKKLNEISLKNNLKYKRADGNYSRKPGQLINYFSKRLAGSFEHEQDGSSWMYQDLFSPKEYYNIFYRNKRFLTRGFNSKQVKDVKKKIKEGLLRLEETISPNNTNNEQRTTCQYCGNPEYEREFVEDPTKSNEKPPDNSNLKENCEVFLGGDLNGLRYM